MESSIGDNILSLFSDTLMHQLISCVSFNIVGGLISVMAVLKLGSYHVKGLILTAPALGVDMNIELKIQKLFAPGRPLLDCII